jgi:GAF domain-containing protein
MSDVILQQNLSYDDLFQQLQSLVADEMNPLANMANMSSLLYFSLRDINWIGFYLRDRNELVLGPFQGKPACVRIQIGNGVCGTAVKETITLTVDDVRQFPGHIACNTDSCSEIVVPLVLNNQIIGVLDVDSPVIKRFGDEEKIFFERCISLLLNASTGWEKYYE